METLENVRLLRQDTILREWWSEVNENFWETDAKERGMSEALIYRWRDQVLKAIEGAFRGNGTKAGRARLTYENRTGCRSWEL